MKKYLPGNVLGGRRRYRNAIAGGSHYALAEATFASRNVGPETNPLIVVGFELLPPATPGTIMPKVRTKLRGGVDVSPDCKYEVKSLLFRWPIESLRFWSRRVSGSS
jgi:hypothetical protein